MGSSAGEYDHDELPRVEVLRVAGEARVDPRCVVRYVRRFVDNEDIPMRSSTIAHVERALAALGYGRLIDPRSAYALAREARRSERNGGGGSAR